MSAVARLCALLLCLLSVTAQAQSSSEQDRLQSKLKAFLDGASRNDAAIHDAFWDEDLVYTSSNGTRFGKSELMAGVRSEEAPSADQPVPIYHAADIDIRLYGQTAVVAFTLIASAPDGAEESRYFNTGTFVLRGDDWRAVAWQATRIPKAEPTAPAATNTDEGS